MQWLAMLTMLIDHIGVFFYPDDPIWRVIGRLAFPLYAYAFVRGYQLTRSRDNYLWRLFWIASAAQFAYFALGLYRLNVIYSFLFAAAVFWLVDRFKNKYMSVLVVAAAVMFFELCNLEYGAYGLLLMLVYRYAAERWRWSLVALVTYVGVLSYGLPQAASLAAVIAVLLIPGLQERRYTAPRWLWRSFYPVHLYVIAILLFLEG